jgi:hypothetical protein
LVCAVLLILVSINIYYQLPVPYTAAYYFLKVHLHHFAKIKSHKEVKNSSNQGFSHYFCFIKEGSGYGSVPLTNESRIRIQKAQKHTDPTDPDPQHWSLLSPGGTWHCGGHTDPAEGSAGDPSMR